jgi:transcription elongation GreA/GreB family factor
VLEGDGKMVTQIADRITLGTWVKVKGLVPGEETVIQFVPEDEENHLERKLAPDSFLGKVLMGAEVGDKVPIGAADTEMAVEVLDMGRMR